MYVSANDSVFGHPGLGAAHTPNHLPLSLYQCFRRSRRSTRGAFLLPSIRSAYRLTVHLPNAKYKVNSNPAFPPPMTYLNDESETDHYERMCVTMKSSRKSPQTSIPVSNHWVASRKRLSFMGKKLVCLQVIGSNLYPSRCNNNLLIFKISSTCFGQYFAHHQERETEIFTAYVILLFVVVR